MKPEEQSKYILALTRSKAKMNEFGVPKEEHFPITKSPEELFPLTIGLVGDLAAQINRGKNPSLVDIPVSFASLFFESYAKSLLSPSIGNYTLLLAAASFYLADHPGNAAVLARMLDADAPPFNDQNLERAILKVLRPINRYQGVPSYRGRYVRRVVEILDTLETFWKNGELGNIDELLRAFRRDMYDSGTEKELFLADVFCAVIRTKLRNSSWQNLPEFTGISKEKWIPALQKTTFPKELWPAQMQLARSSVLAGLSAIVQMPTSAGKTKAIEIIVRSAFLAERTKLAIIVTPFRALCREVSLSLEEAFAGEGVVIDEFSDVLQDDFGDISSIAKETIIVVTPEKLLYVIRQSPTLVPLIGLIIYDEGHQFDSGKRGVTYELLLTSLSGALLSTTQTVLISAVISAAEQIATWLLKEDARVVSGEGIQTTFRTTAFASWRGEKGQLRYTEGGNPDKEEYFVPTLIKPETLPPLGRGKSADFPTKNNSGEIATYLALKLAPQGTVALFSGRKSTAINTCGLITHVYQRGFSLPPPSEWSDKDELERIAYQCAANLGEQYEVTEATRYGVLSHHTGIPFGVRVSVEHAVRAGRARMIVCTSTLAQGVNIPIRYLILAGTQQGGKALSKRDFTNLIGRAGRAGMHTEGSVIFSDNELYDNRKNAKSYQWGKLKELLSLGDANDAASSSLLSLFEPLKTFKGKPVHQIDVLELVATYTDLAGLRGAQEAVLQTVALQNKMHITYDKLVEQFDEKLGVIAQIESFLMAHGEPSVEASKSLAESTLAHFLASEEQKDILVAVFAALSANIEAKALSTSRRQAFGRTLLSLADNLAIEEWVRDNFDYLSSDANEDELFSFSWPILKRYIKEPGIVRIAISDDDLKAFAMGWIGGLSFHDLYAPLKAQDARIGVSQRPRTVTLTKVVEMCESGFAFDGMLILGAIKESMETMWADVDRFESLQRRVKYGVSTSFEAFLYESGLKDRVLVKQLFETGALAGADTRKKVFNTIRGNDACMELLKRFPKCFEDLVMEKSDAVDEGLDEIPF